VRGGYFNAKEGKKAEGRKAVRGFMWVRKGGRFTEKVEPHLFVTPKWVNRLGWVGGGGSFFACGMRTITGKKIGWKILLGRYVKAA